MFHTTLTKIMRCVDSVMDQQLGIRNQKASSSNSSQVHCIHLRTNILRKGINPSFLPAAMDSTAAIGSPVH